MAACSIRSCFGCPAVVLQHNGMTVIVMNSMEELQGLAPAQPQQAADAAHCRQLLLQGILALTQQLADAEAAPGHEAATVPQATGGSTNTEVYITAKNWQNKPRGARYHVHAGCMPGAAAQMIKVNLTEVVAAGIQECTHCIPKTRQMQPGVAATNFGLNLWMYAGAGAGAAACCALALLPWMTWS